MKAAANKVSNHSWVSALLMKQSKWLCHSWDSSVIVLLLRLGLITQEHFEIIPWPLPQEQLWPKYLDGSALYHAQLASSLVLLDLYSSWLLSHMAASFESQSPILPVSWIALCNDKLEMTLFSKPWFALLGKAVSRSSGGMLKRWNFVKTYLSVYKALSQGLSQRPRGAKADFSAECCIPCAKKCLAAWWWIMFWPSQVAPFFRTWIL